MSLKYNIFLKARASLRKHFLSVLLKTVMVEFVEVFCICFILFSPQYSNTKLSGLLLRCFGVFLLTVARVFLVVTILNKLHLFLYCNY